MVVVAALFACARDNPFFDDGATGGASGPGTATSPTSASASSTTQGPGTTSSGESSGDSLSDTDPIATSNGSTTGTTGSIGESSFTTGTSGCFSVEVEAVLRADAFAVTRGDCSECGDFNYGASGSGGLFVEGAGESYYVMRFDMLPFGAEVVSATLVTGIERPFNEGSSGLHIHVFTPGCNWSEGTGTGDGPIPADGITYNDCNPPAATGYPLGDFASAMGEPLGDPVGLGGMTGLLEVEFPLYRDAVQTWLDDFGDSLVLGSDAVEGGILKPTREDAAGGGVTLIIEVCE